MAGLFFFPLQLLHVDGMKFFHAVHYGRLRVILSAAEFFEHSGAFVFPFEFLEGFFDVFTLFDRHDNHDVALFL